MAFDFLAECRDGVESEERHDADRCGAEDVSRRVEAMVVEGTQSETARPETVMQRYDSEDQKQHEEHNLHPYGHEIRTRGHRDPKPVDHQSEAAEHQDPRGAPHSGNELPEGDRDQHIDEGRNEQIVEQDHPARDETCETPERLAGKTVYG